MTKNLVHVTLLLGLLATPAWAARPEWCRPGFVCLESKVAAQREHKIIDLEKDLAIAKAKRLKRFGWTAGPALIAAPDGDVTAGVGLMFGFRF